MKKLAKSAFLSFLSALFLLPGLSSSAGTSLFPVADDPSKEELAMSAAFDGVNFLVPVMSDHVGTSDMYGYGELFVQFVSADGALVGGPITVAASDGGIRDASVVWGGGKYLVLWMDGCVCDTQGPIETYIRGVFVGADGSVGTPFTVAQGTSSWNPDNWECDSTVDIPGAAYGSGMFCVIYEEAPLNAQASVKARLIDVNGTLGPSIAVSQSPARLHMGPSQVAFGGTGFMVIYNYDDDHNTKVLARMLDLSGQPSGGEITIDSSSYPSDNPSAVASDGTRFLVVWTDEVSGPVDDFGTWHFYGNFVGADGGVSSKFPVSTFNGWKMAPSVAVLGDRFLVTWIDGRNCSQGDCPGNGTGIYGQVLNWDGTLSGGEFPVEDGPESELGGFSGGLVNGKVFGVVCRNWSLPSPVTDDVFAAFWSPDSPAVTGVQKLGSPFRLKLFGSNFHQDLKVYIGGDQNPWAYVRVGSQSQVVLKGGTALKARFPKGVPVEIKVVNGDGGTAVTTYTR